MKTLSLYFFLLLSFLAVLDLAVASNSNDVERILQAQEIIPEEQCTIFREAITTCASSCSSSCPAFQLNDGYNPPVPCDDDKPAGPICFQIKDWISCCDQCKTEFDEMADCMLGTGRVIDDAECDALCGNFPSSTMARGFYCHGCIVAAATGVLLLASWW